MSLLQETKDIQRKMALFCRTGESVDLPGITPNRLHHYRRLVYHIIQDHLESSFPIAFEYIDTATWEAMVFDFFSHHTCQAYQVWQIPGEFYEYAITQDFASKYQLAYINDLLKFEWEEMRVYNMEDIRPEDCSAEGDVLNDILVLNPEHTLLQFEYPVHLHNPMLAAKKKGHYYALLYREEATGKVQFIDLSPWYALVIEQMASQDITLNALLNEAPRLFGNVDLEDLTATTCAFIKELRARAFVLGFKKNNKRIKTVRNL